jgi:hypothetical protein
MSFGASENQSLLFAFNQTGIHFIVVGFRNDKAYSMIDNRTSMCSL